MKRWVRLLVSMVLLSSWSVYAQESDQPLDTRASSSDSLNGRVPNVSGLEVLTKTTPREIRNYPFRILAAVRNKWFPQLRELEHSMGWRQAATVVEFEINRDGSLGDARTIESTGDAGLDAAALQAISKAAPFPPLPETFPGEQLRLRYHFGYDQPASADAPMCNGPDLGAHPTDYVVRKVGNGVMPPHATNSNDPEYSDAARRMKYQSRVRIAGTVDPHGAFTDLCVLVAAGNGLDENAMSAVKAWRFEPATLNGEPVAVRINVEADFRLY